MTEQCGLTLQENGTEEKRTEENGTEGWEVEEGQEWYGSG
jgi:hypothetical protein